MSAALCSAVYEYLGAKPSTKDFVDVVLASEKLFNPDGGSEVDIRAVLSNSPLKAKREFLLDGSVKIRCDEVPLSLPSGTQLIFVDVFGEKSPAVDPEALHDVFAKGHGFVRNTGKTKSPKELTAGERAKVSDPLNSIADRIAAEMSPSGSPEKLASLLDLNHAILADAGVSSKQVENACALAKSEGALGAKMSGVGGNSILVYCKPKNAEGIMSALKSSGCACYGISFSSKGAYSYR
jgi:mevalonate kinase